MFDEIKIGTGSHGNSAVRAWKAFESKHYISKNCVSFWVQSCILGTSIMVMWDTPEGKFIGEKLDELSRITENDRTSDTDEQEKVFCDYLDNLVLKNFTLEQFKNKMMWALEDAHDAGVRSNQEKMRDILGL